MHRGRNLRLALLVTALVTSPALSLLSSVARAGAGVNDTKEVARELREYPLRDLNGDTHTLSEYRGEVVVVNFWASWCTPCLQEMPALDAWNTRWLDKGARVVAVSVDHEVGNARRFVDKAKLTLEVCHDGSDGLAKRLDLPSLPCTYVLDKSGELALVTGKSGNEALNEIEKTVERLMASTSSARVQTTALNGGAR